MERRFQKATDVLDRIMAESSFEAGYLPSDEKERLCRSLLAEFGVTHVQVRGSELIHGCVLPFGRHKDQDRNPTASLNYEKLTYKCFGCQSGGGLLWFIALCRGIDTDDARKWLDTELGVGADEQSLASLLAYFDAVYNPQRESTAAPMPKMSTKVLEPWLAIHPYMTEDRGCTEETLMEFLVGYAPDYRVRLPNGDFVESQRIILPHIWKGDLVGWQSRRLSNDGTPKYVNSPDFPKDSTLYNYDPRRDAVVVESPLSVLAMHHRTKVFEATFSASLTDRQIRLLAQHRRVVLWFDNDEAGWKATRKAGDALEGYGSVWVVDSPYAADPADFVKVGRMDDALKLLADPVPYALWSPPTTLVELEGVTQ